MLSGGFLGTRADWLLDLVICALVVIVPAVAVSWRLARRREWVKHRNIQVGLVSVLTVAVSAFECDLRAAGGIWELTRASGYAGTALLRAVVYTHMTFSISTAALWISLTATSLAWHPSRFAIWHRWLGRLAMTDMLLTGATAVPLYLLAFVF